jgi:hypothetical protein
MTLERRDAVRWRQANPICFRPFRLGGASIPRILTPLTHLFIELCYPISGAGALADLHLLSAPGRECKLFRKNWCLLSEGDQTVG